MIDGYPPELIGDVDCCSFAERWPWAVDEGRQGAPSLDPVGDDDATHAAACVRADEAYELYEAEGTDPDGTGRTIAPEEDD